MPPHNWRGRASVVCGETRSSRDLKRRVPRIAHTLAAALRVWTANLHSLNSAALTCRRGLERSLQGAIFVMPRPGAPILYTSLIWWLTNGSDRLWPETALSCSQVCSSLRGWEPYEPSPRYAPALCSLNNSASTPSWGHLYRCRPGQRRQQYGSSIPHSGSQTS